MLTKKIIDMLASDAGQAIYDRINRYIKENNIDRLLADGVLVGLSGGADSVMLLSFLYEYRRRTEHFNIIAVHINHMIRGEDAERDESFALNFAKSLGIEAVVRKIDVPTLSRGLGVGLEEAAREARYSAFADIIRGRNDVSYIATAHNIGDNMETVLFNILRGAGALGASGIAPVRDNIIRPMLSVSKSDILSLLDEWGIEYCVDKTNLSSDYTRNFLRNEISPLLSSRFPHYETAFLRFGENMRDVYDFLSGEARRFVADRDTVLASELLALPMALFSEVMCILSDERLNRDTICKLHSLLLSSENFSYDIKGSRKFICERGVCRVAFGESENFNYKFDLKIGLNEFSDFSTAVYISNEPLPKTYLNIYKIAIQDRIPSDIIYGVLYIRPRITGDTIYYGGMTHKIKKLFCDRKIPNSKKSLIPVFCDDKGPIYLPGYHVREENSSLRDYLYVYLLEDEKRGGKRFLTGKDFSR